MQHRLLYRHTYAFELGDILFVSVDATVVGHLPRQQTEWLRGVLAKYGPDHRWRILFSHVPLWSFAQGREREYIGDPELQLLLEEANVDFYQSGHLARAHPLVRRGAGTGGSGGRERHPARSR